MESSQINVPRESDSTTRILLEEKLSFQQHQLDELNAVVLRHQAELEQLRRELAAVVSGVRANAS